MLNSIGSFISDIAASAQELFWSSLAMLLPLLSELHNLWEIIMEKGKALLLKLLPGAITGLVSAVVTIIFFAFAAGNEWNEYTTMKIKVKETSESVITIGKDVAFIRGQLSK